MRNFLRILMAFGLLMTSFSLFANSPPGLQKQGFSGIPHTGKVPPGWSQGVKRGWNKNKNWHWNKETKLWENKNWVWDTNTHGWVKRAD